MGSAILNRFKHPLVSISFEGTEKVISFHQKKSVNQLVLSEDIANGERILAYELFAKINNSWKKCAVGTSVGNKRIQLFKSTFAKEFKLRITKYKALPKVLKFELHHVIESLFIE